MKLTLALGLQYDDGRSLRQPDSEAIGENRAPLPALIAEPVTTQPVPADRMAMQFSFNHGVSFLTYNLNGLPEFAVQGPVKVDLFA